MTDVDNEREFWEGKAAHSKEVAVDAIGGALWNEDHLHSDIGRILEAMAPMRQLSIGQRKQLKAPIRILDLGCGIGRLAVPLADLLPGFAVYGVDIAPSMIERAKTVDQAGDVIWRIGDGRGIPADLLRDLSGEFCLVYSILTFQHMPREAVAGYVQQISHLLCTGGRLLFQTLEGTAASFLWNELDEKFICGVCASEGLNVMHIDRELSKTDDRAISLWVTAVKS